MADIKIYGTLVANTEDQVVADASSIQDTTRNQKLSVTLNELAQGTGLKVLDVNLNNYLSQDGLLALIQGINYATVGDAISYQFSSSIAVDSSYNAVHVTGSISGQGGIDLYLLKSINDKFSCETLVSDGYNSKYKTIQNATLITSSGYIRGIVVTNELVGNLCDLVNGRSELTSTKLSYWFPVGVLPTHIKLANDIIIDLQGNEYCAIGSETIDAEISNRVYLNVVKIDINGDFSNVSANDVKVVDFLWQHIENPSNFSFDDLPRFSDSSDVADFPGSSGGSGSGGSGKLYEYKFNLTAYDIDGNVNEFSFIGVGSKTSLPFEIQIYESNFEKCKTKFNQLAQMAGATINIDTPQDFVNFINSSMNETIGSVSISRGYLVLYYLICMADKSTIKLPITIDGGTTLDSFIMVESADILGNLFGWAVAGDIKIGLNGIKTEDGNQYEYIFGLNVNNSCTLTEYGTSASSGDTPSQSESSFDYVQMCFNSSNNDHIILMFDKKYSRNANIPPQVNQLITTLNQMGNLSIPAYTDLESLADIADYLNVLDTQTYAQIKVVFWASVLSLYPYLCLTIKGYDNGMVVPVIVEGIADMTNQNFAYTIKMMDNTGAMVTRADEQTVFDFDIFVNDLD